jgi:DNA segregation ATPase FtsK/SpoIIIE-like protein
MDHTHDQYPHPPQRQTALTGLLRIMGMGLRNLWHWRQELAMLLIAVAFLTGLVILPTVHRLAIALIAATLAVKGRLHIARWTRSARAKRAWRRAMNDLGLDDRCRRVRHIAAGQKLDVTVARGRSVAGLEARAPELAASLQVQEVRVQQDRKNARKATVTLVRQDPFVDMPPVPWPGLNPDSTPSVWEPVRIGTNEDGNPQTLKLVGNQILIGGVTGSGKSMLMRAVEATAALDTTARLWLLDAKLIELTPWAGVAEALVSDNAEEALRVLRHLKDLTDKRQREILASENGWDKITRASGLPVHIIVVDELGEYATMPEGKEILSLLASIARRGRALGIVVVAATQSPYADVIPSELRTQFKTRIVFRCMDRGHASTIVGNTPTAALAAAIDPDLPGVGYSLDESGLFARFRTVLVTRPDPDEHPDWDDQVSEIVNRASGLRVDAGLAALQALPPVGETPTGSPSGNGGQGSGNGKRRKPSSGKPQGPSPEMIARVREHLGEEPVRQSAVAERLGRHPGDGTVRRVLEHLERQGQARKTEEGWVET